LGELEAIKRTSKPHTQKSLVSDLKGLGLREKDIVLVHSSLKSLGWVCGGAVTVIKALQQVVTVEGTLIMPAHSGNLSDPSQWENPPVPESWWEIIKKEMPAFDPEITPTTGLGVIPELFRSFPGVFRSNHPAVSFSGWGRDAREILKEHPLEFSMGEKSPLGRLYDLRAKVLFLGTDYSTSTSFHLAEYSWEDTEIEINGAPVIEEGKRVWKEYRDIKLRDELFQRIGLDWEKENKVEKGWVGSAQGRLFSLTEAVDFARRWR